MDELVCIDCEATHPRAVSRCPCGGALDRIEPLGSVAAGGLRGTAEGLRRFADAFGLAAGEMVTLGEGGTPLLADEALGVFLKLEDRNPTGSFKDRGASVLISQAARLGVDRVTEDSSGNAGAAMAAYAARAGLGCTVFAPEHITPAKRARIEALGAQVRVVEGARSGVTEAAHAATQDEGGAYYASHTYPPFFVEGCQSIAFELVASLGQAPDAVVAPCAMGSVVLGVASGFERLVMGGVVEEVPPVFAVQAAGCDPVADAFGYAGEGDNRLADGLLVPKPPREAQLVDTIEAAGGCAVAVSEAQTRAAMERLHRRGVLVEASSATALAGLDRFREEGLIDEGARPVLVLTGAWSP